MNYGQVVQNIVNQVVETCKRHNVELQEEYCAYYVKLLKLDPNWRILDDFSYRQLDLQRFVQYIASRFQNPDDPEMKIIKLQYYIESVRNNLVRFADDRKKILSKTLEPLRSLILNYDHHSDGLHKVMDFMIYYLTLASGLGNPRDPKVYREVKTVLISVMDKDELVEFLETEVCVRKEKLDMLSRTVAGIRLFNHASLKIGKGIPNLPLLLENSIALIRKAVSGSLELKKVKRKIRDLSVALDSCYTIRKTKRKIMLDCQLPSFATEEDLDYTKQLLALNTQFSMCIGKLLEGINTFEEKLLTIKDSYNRLLSFLRERVKRKMSVTASVLFPAFEKLYEWWECFQDETVVLTTLRLTFEELFTLMKSVNFDTVLTKIPSDDNFQHDIAKKRHRSYTAVPHTSIWLRWKLASKNMRIYKKDVFPNLNKIKLEYSGFCCWKLVATNGVLSPGNPDHGIVGYHNKYYIFCSPLGLESFANDPDYYIRHVLDLARKNCELIGILCIREEMQTCKYIRRIVEDLVDVISIYSLQAQSPSISEGFDKNYEWNVWKMKKKALQMAYLKRCKTTSSQTIKTSLSRSIGVQADPLKEKAIQTKSDVTTNTPKPLRHFAGLRGKMEERRPFCLDLTYWTDFDYKNKIIK